MEAIAGSDSADVAKLGEERQTPYLFGDLLAIARAHWVRRMAAGVSERGHGDYRSTDAVLVRILRRADSVALSKIGERIGVTRQAARKLVDGLEQRGYAVEARDEEDGRIVRVSLTPAGLVYADAVIEVVHTLNRELAERVSVRDLAAAAVVLRATIDDDARAVADRMVPPR